MFCALEVAEERRAAEVCKRPPDVGLEQNDDREHDIRREVSDDPVDGLELQPLRQKIQQQNKTSAQCHLRRARAADEEKQLVDEERDDRDVERVGPPDIGPAEERGQPVHESTR